MEKLYVKTFGGKWFTPFKFKQSDFNIEVSEPELDKGVVRETKKYSRQPSVSYSVTFRLKNWEDWVEATDSNTSGDLLHELGLQRWDKQDFIYRSECRKVSLKGLRSDEAKRNRMESTLAREEGLFSDWLKVHKKAVINKLNGHVVRWIERQHEQALKSAQSMLQSDEWRGWVDKHYAEEIEPEKAAVDAAREALANATERLAVKRNVHMLSALSKEKWVSDDVPAPEEVVSAMRKTLVDGKAFTVGRFRIV